MIDLKIALVLLLSFEIVPSSYLELLLLLVSVAWLRLKLGSLEGTLEGFFYLLFFLFFFFLLEHYLLG